MKELKMARIIIKIHPIPTRWRTRKAYKQFLEHLYKVDKDGEWYDMLSKFKNPEKPYWMTKDYNILEADNIVQIFRGLNFAVETHYTNKNAYMLHNFFVVTK
jgi:hypothetical protein